MSATKGKKSKQKQEPENEIHPSVQIVAPSLYEIPICALKELAYDFPVWCGLTKYRENTVRKKKVKTIQALVTKNTYEFRDTVEIIVDCMKPGTYTNPGIPLYQNDIDRCEYDTMTNEQYKLSLQRIHMSSEILLRQL